MRYIISSIFLLSGFLLGVYILASIIPVIDYSKIMFLSFIWIVMVVLVTSIFGGSLVLLNLALTFFKRHFTEKELGE